MLPRNARYPIALLALSAGLATAGCTARSLAAPPPGKPASSAAAPAKSAAAPTKSAPAPTSSATSPSAPATVSPPASAAATPTASATVAPTASPSPPLRFPNTTFTAELLDYDRQLGMIVFRKAVRYRSPIIQDHFGIDPSDKATHRLPLARNARVFGGGGQVCPGDAPRCTTTDLINALQHPNQPVVADLVVDSTDHITTAAEQLGVFD